MLLAICNKCWYQVAGGVAGAIHPHARGRTTTRSIMAHAPHVLLALAATARLVRPVPCPPQPPRSQVCLHASNYPGAVGLFPYAPPAPVVSMIPQPWALLVVGRNANIRTLALLAGATYVCRSA